MDVAEKLIRTHELSREEYTELLMHWEDAEQAAQQREEAVKISVRYY